MLTEQELLRIKQDIEESSDNSEMIWHRGDIKRLFEHIDQLQQKIDCLDTEFDEITRDRNVWRSNSLDWEGEE